MAGLPSRSILTGQFLQRVETIESRFGMSQPPRKSDHGRVPRCAWLFRRMGNALQPQTSECRSGMSRRGSNCFPASGRWSDYYGAAFRFFQIPRIIASWPGPGTREEPVSGITRPERRFVRTESIITVFIACGSRRTAIDSSVLTTRRFLPWTVIFAE